MFLLNEVLACPACTGALQEEGPGLRCECGTYPVVGGIPVLTPWALGRRFSVEELLARHQPVPGGLAGKLLRRLLPGVGRLRRAITRPRATFLELVAELRRDADLDYFRYRFSDLSYISSCALLTAVSRGPVLDLGCGTGHFERALSRRVPADQLVGVDFNYTLLYLARRFLAPGAAFVCADASRRLPFRDGAFEAAACIDAFNYLPDRASAAREIQRVARGPILLSRLADPSFQGRGSQPPLEPDRYIEMFSGRRPILCSDREILRRFLDTRMLDLSHSCRDPREVLTLAAGIASGTYPGADYFVGGSNLRLNPLYGVQGRRLQRRFLSPRHEEAYRPYAAALPPEVEGDPSTPTPELVRKFVFVDLPANYA